MYSCRLLIGCILHTIYLRMCRTMSLNPTHYAELAQGYAVTLGDIHLHAGCSVVIHKEGENDGYIYGKLLAYVTNGSFQMITVNFPTITLGPGWQVHEAETFEEYNSRAPLPLRFY